jgi:uncharacterized protein YoxC
LNFSIGKSEMGALKRYLAVCLLLGVWGCGGDENKAETPYGNAEDVRVYREQINPLIDEINAIEMEVQETAVGASGQATAANIAAACELLCQRLRAVLEELEAIEPPALLAPLHREVRQVVLLRLEAYNAVLEGLGEQDEQLFSEAVEKLNQANVLAAQLNEDLEEVDQTLASAKRTRVLAGM